METLPALLDTVETRIASPSIGRRTELESGINKSQFGAPEQHQRIFILVTEFSRENCPFSNRDHTWRQFHTFRNAVLDILSSYGTVGPVGKMPILDTYEESADEWRGGAKNPDFFVVDDDIYGLGVRVEASWNLTKPALLEELAMFLKQWQEWSVYLALVKGGLFIFHDRILYEGIFFAGCSSVEDLYHRCALETNVDAP